MKRRSGSDGPEADRPQRVAATDLCAASESFVVTVGTGSMAPGIPAGSRVRVETVPAAALMPGDVALLRRDGRFFLHRYLGTVRQDGAAFLFCRGDAARRADPPWPGIALVGRAVAVCDTEGGEKAISVTPRQRLAARVRGLVCAVRFSLRRRKRRCGADGSEGDFRIGWRDRVWRVTIAAGSPWPTAAVRSALRCAPRTAERTAFLKLEPLEEGGSIRGPDSLFLEMPKMRFGVDWESGNGVVALEKAAAAERALSSFFRLAAIREAARYGGVALHATCARSKRSGRVYVFAGPPECGKTTSAASTGTELDGDFVLLLPRKGGWSRVPWLPFDTECHDETPVTAVFRPGRGEKFSLTRLHGAAAVERCLHLPGLDVPKHVAGALLGHACALAEAVPVYELAWRKGTDLGAFLDREITSDDAG